MAVMQQNPRTITAPNAQGWTTPRRLEAALAALWLVTGLLLLTVLVGSHQRWQALQTIGREAAPSMIGAQQIKAGLSDMDAAAADVLLLPAGIAQEQTDERYEQRRIEVTEHLTQAAQSVNYGEAERQPLRTLADALGTYETDVAQARLLHLRGELGSRLVYRITHSEMHDTLLPAADALDQANAKVLESAYQHQQSASAVNVVLLWVLGLGLTAILLALQIFLSMHVHRTVNLPLLGATVLVLVFLLGTTHLFSRESGTLRSVKDAFSSISLLWETRATAFDANAEESRWLMDTPQAPQYAQIYSDDAGRIAGVMPANDRIYEAADRKLRALEDGGSHAAAVTFCVGRKPGQHDWAFAQLSDALGQTLGSDQQAFDAAVTKGVQQQSGFDAEAVLALIAVAALAGLGLRPRLQEYAAGAPEGT